MSSLSYVTYNLFDVTFKTNPVTYNGVLFS